MLDDLLAASQMLTQPTQPAPPPTQLPRSRPQLHRLDQAGLQEALALRLEGWSLRRLGKRYGLTGERMRQLLAIADPEHTRKAMAVRRAARQHAEGLAQARRAERAERAGRECRICYGTVVGGNRVTCSTRCAELWLLCAYHLDNERRERRRAAAARWVVNNPHRVTQYQLRYAQRVLAGTSKRRGQWTNSAEIALALKEVAILRGGGDLLSR